MLETLMCFVDVLTYLKQSHYQLNTKFIKQWLAPHIFQCSHLELRGNIFVFSIAMLFLEYMYEVLPTSTIIPVEYIIHLCFEDTGDVQFYWLVVTPPQPPPHTQTHTPSINQASTSFSSNSHQVKNMFHEWKPKLNMAHWWLPSR